MQNLTGAFEHEIKGKAEIHMAQQVRKKRKTKGMMNVGED